MAYDPNVVRIVKSSPASRSYGRGRDNYRSSARYDVLVYGKPVARISARDARYMETPVWEVVSLPDYRPIKTIWTGGFAAAKAFALIHFIPPLTK